MKTVLKRIAVIFVALLLLVYIGFQVYMATVTPLSTETVGRATAYETLEAEGMVFRDESVLAEATGSGYLFYTVHNGGRVAKGGTIADRYASQADALAQQELEALDAEIADLKSINAQGTANRASLTAINQQIDATWQAIARAGQTGSLDAMAELRARLLTLLNKQQITIGRVENFDAQLATLEAKRTKLAKSFRPSSGRVTSPVAGYFISYLDGYESYCATKGVTELTVGKLREALEYKPTVPSGIGKVVGNYEWYLACELSVDQAAELKAGAMIEVEMPLVTSEAVPMTVAAINKDGEGRAVLVLRCTQMSPALSIARTEHIRIRLKKHEGVRIPDKAIYFNEAQEPGAYVQTGNTLTFRRIRMLHHDTVDKFAVCELTEEAGFVRLYDKIVVKGEDLYDGKLVR